MMSRITDIALPTVTVVALLLIWHFSIGWFAIPAYLVPEPLDVVVALRKGLIEGTLWIHIGATLSAVALGYVLGCFLALVCAALMSEFDLVEKAFYPLVVGFQSIPKVALAPLLIVWFGFGLQSKVVLVALMCFFPCFINTVVGLKSYDRNLEALYRAFGSGKLDIFWSVKLPAALGHIFAGLQVSVILAILGAGGDKDPVGATKHVLVTLTDMVSGKGYKEPLRFTSALSNGRDLYAFRYSANDTANSLYYQESGGNVVVVSEPLEGERSQWKPVPPGHVIVARAGQPVLLEPFLVEQQMAAE